MSRSYSSSWWVSLGLLVPLLGGCAASTHHRNGMNAMSQGQYLSGVVELQKAVEQAPDEMRYRLDWLQAKDKAVGLLLNQAEIAAGTERPEEAAQLYDNVLQLDPQHARAITGKENLARQRAAAEDAGKAREALKLGDTSLALLLANRALAVKPDLAEARAVKRELEAQQANELLTAPSLASIYRKPLNLEFRDASIKMVFDALSRTTGINFIFDRDVKPELRTTVLLKQTTLEDAIDVILTTSQLEKKILNPTSVLIYPSGRTKTKEYQDLVVRAFYLASSDAKQTANLLKTVLKLQNVFVDDKLNMLVLRETPEAIALAEKLVALYDLDEPEVMLDVEVLEVKRSRLLDLGIKVTDQLVISPLNVTTSGTSSLVKLGDLKGLNASNLGVNLPKATLTFRKEDGDANLLANPRIRVRDREKAKIHIGDKVPLVTTTTSSTGFVSDSVQYIDVGLKLEVEPRIYLRDEVDIKVGLEVSSLVNTIKSPSGSLAYQIGNRSASSVLRLKDGETQVLAGLINDEDRSAANRIPFLGDLPIVGRLFSSQKDDRQKTEIVLSITPRLIRNMQRREPAAEMFWSGTEATLRNKPLLLRSAEKPAPAAARTSKSATPKGDTANTGLQLTWQGPQTVKQGQPFTVDLQLDTRLNLRAAPLQLAFDPAAFEVVTVKAGDFFGSGASFNQVVDKASGRISIGAATAAAAGSKGQGSLLRIELRPIGQAGEANLSVIGFTPIGSGEAVPAVPLPLVHTVDIGA
ncbi:MAG: general secretion pathway protein GspD [Elusimicrobia bacterium]|nr:MAG: general secretion pathway protein GspD [Elusimicrobiota bacterium]